MRSPRHQRRSIRLKDYNYSQAGAYFITLCTHDRLCLFGDVGDGVVRLNDAGLMVQQCWLNIPCHFPHVVLDAYVVMPNHLHGIIVIIDTVGAKNFSPLPAPGNQAIRSPSKTVGSIIRGFKIGATKWFRENTPIYTVWQRNYYEHIIRDEWSLNRIRQYILENPSQWAFDRENPGRGLIV